MSPLCLGHLKLNGNPRSPPPADPCCRGWEGGGGASVLVPDPSPRGLGRGDQNSFWGWGAFLNSPFHSDSESEHFEFEYPQIGKIFFHFYPSSQMKNRGVFRQTHDRTSKITPASNNVKRKATSTTAIPLFAWGPSSPPLSFHLRSHTHTHTNICIHVYEQLTEVG